jgi:hypothetical protein
MRYTRIFVSLVLLTFCTLSLFGQDAPAAPLTDDVITCFPDTTGYMRITVGPVDRDYSDLQEAIDAAPLGSVLLLDAGASFNGSFLLPDKGDGDEWIVIMSSRMDVLPGDTVRIDPDAPTPDGDFLTQASAMPKIITTNLSGLPCFKTQPGAHHYRLTGLEITADVNVNISFGLVNLGESGASQQTLEDVPHHFVIDRCYIHGHTEATIMKYGIRMDCANAAVVDCHISDFHSVGFDAQAISGINGPGPFKIINNYLEASGENILFGGGAPSIPGLVPSDIEIRQNYFYKPWSWRVGHPEYAGKHWTIKNLFELKTGRRVWVDGNIMENCWADLPVGQSGYAILLTVRTEAGSSPQADVSDVRISNNIIRHVGAGITLSGTDAGLGNRSARILIDNNLFEDINGPAYGDQNVAGPNDGTFLKIGEPRDVAIVHNTILQSGPVTWAYAVTDSFVYTHNISHSYISAGGYQGIYGPGQSQGNSTITKYFPDITDANRHMHKNVMIGGNSSRYSNFSTISENYFPADTHAVGFVAYTQGPEDYHGYALTPASPYYQAGDDGLDLGVDFISIDQAFVRPRGCGQINTGVYQDQGEELVATVYPNPVSDYLKVTMVNHQPFEYQILDFSGHKVRQGTADGYGVNIGLHGLAPGPYTLYLTSGIGRSSYRFVIL